MEEPGTDVDTNATGREAASRAEAFERGIAAARDVLAHEAKAAADVSERPCGLQEALRLLLDAPGRLVVTGLGKSGLIAAKLAATFASTGTPAQFVHAADALHGDSGMVRPGDVVLALSKSGETAEVLSFVHLVRARGVPVISLTGCSGGSSLCRLADVVLDAAVDREADPFDLVPSTSTTVSLMLGDALAIGLMAARNFGPADFLVHHPGGSLGLRRDAGAND